HRKSPSRLNQMDGFLELLVMRLFAHSLETPSGLIDSFSPESFVNKESMCNFAARFNRKILNH
ncbi:hypothetical protein, partial [Jeotgalibaca porci]|uniref:hypothetical protein n=1 Tax=Jeotgalibaca porci TaxID=1868793 RepID=UPI0035A1C494